MVGFWQEPFSRLQTAHVLSYPHATLSYISCKRSERSLYSWASPSQICTLEGWKLPTVQTVGPVATLNSLQHRHGSGIHLSPDHRYPVLTGRTWWCFGCLGFSVSSDHVSKSPWNIYMPFTPVHNYLGKCQGSLREKDSENIYFVLLLQHCRVLSQVGLVSPSINSVWIWEWVQVWKACEG